MNVSDPRLRTQTGTTRGHNSDGSKPTAVGYGAAATAYLENGYTPLPLTGAGKGETPVGATGYNGVAVTPALVQEWAKRYRSDGLCVRMDGLVGIDVDAYGDKTGGATLAALEAIYGELPATVRVSSRLDEPSYDGVSGIRLFRLPERMLPLERKRVWRDPGAGIELIRRAMRQVNSWPTLHAGTGRVYGWMHEDVELVVHAALPPVASLPELPEAWLPALMTEGLSVEDALAGVDAVSGGRADVPGEWLTDGAPCAAVARVLDGAMSQLSAPTMSRHDAMLPKVTALLRLGEQGHRGVEAALDTLEGEFHSVVGQDRSGTEAEWQRMVEGAVGLITSTGLTADENRGCCPAAEDPREVFERASLFDATPTLSHIRQAAHSRGVSAVANLGYVLARVLAEVPPNVMLPAVVGDEAPLNLGVIIVGGSSAGKSVTIKSSRKTLGPVGVSQLDIERPLGSGEGVAEAFLRDETRPGRGGSQVKTGRKLLIPDPRRILVADEVDQIAATQNRSGSTLASVLRTGISGGGLGQQNASADRNRNVPEGSYRLVVFLGVQPTRSGVLLQDADAGTPQRFLWLPAKDPSSPAAVADIPDWPGGLDWRLPKRLPETIDYPQHVQDEVRQSRFEYHHSDDNFDELAGHVRLTRLKVAAALALLHGDIAITDQWWVLAGQLTDLSQGMQRECLRVLGDTKQRGHESVAVAASRAQEAVDEDKVKRTAQLVLAKVKAAKGDWVSKQNARPRLSLRPYMDDAIDALSLSGQIEVEVYQHNSSDATRLRYLGSTG